MSPRQTDQAVAVRLRTGKILSEGEEHMNYEL